MHESAWELPAPARAGRVVCRWPGNLCFWCGARPCARSEQGTELRMTGTAPGVSGEQGRAEPQHRPGRRLRAGWGQSGGMRDPPVLLWGAQLQGLSWNG